MAKKEALDVSTLEGWLWDAACQIRGPLDAPKYKDFILPLIILPLIFLKRLAGVFEDELGRLATELGDAELAAEIAEQDRTMVRFYVPEEARWPQIRQKTTGSSGYRYRGRAMTWRAEGDRYAAAVSAAEILTR